MTTTWQIEIYRKGIKEPITTEEFDILEDATAQLDIMTFNKEYVGLTLVRIERNIEKMYLSVCGRL